MNTSYPKKIVDFHTHLGDVTGIVKNWKPLRINGYVNRNLLAKLDYPPLLIRLLKTFFGQPLIRSAAIDAAKYASATNLIAEMKRSSVFHSVILPIEPYVSTDDILVECKGESSLTPLLSVDLHGNSLSQLEQKIEEKLASFPFKGIKYHPNLQRVPPSDPKVKLLFRLASRFNLFIVTHAGFTPFLKGEVSHYANVHRFGNLFQEFPEVRIILAHMGQYFEERSDGILNQVKKSDNVSLDTSGVGSKIILRGLEKLGPTRILFGSDWPYSSQSDALAILEKAVNLFSHNPLLKKEAKQDILFDNARQLLGI